MSTSVLVTAQEWIKQIESKKKLNKEAKRAVVSFAIWLDSIIDSQELQKEVKHDKEN